MNVSDLSPKELSDRLTSGSLFFRTGPFTFSLRTELPEIIDAFGLLYGDFPVLEPGYADFHASLEKLGGVKSWISPQGTFLSGGVPQFYPFPLKTALPHLEWGLNRCVFRNAHHYLMVHAAVVERGGRALILVGTSGSGKSTLCAALVLRGWRLLSDEIALIASDGSLAGLARPIGLKAESIRIIEEFSPEACMGPGSRGTSKGLIAHMAPPKESVLRVQERAKPSWIFFVSYQADAPVACAPVSKAKALMRIADCAFNYTLLGRQGFETLADVVETTGTFDLVYGNLVETVDLLTALDLDTRLGTRQSQREQLNARNGTSRGLAQAREDGGAPTERLELAVEPGSRHASSSSAEPTSHQIRPSRRNP